MVPLSMEPALQLAPPAVALILLGVTLYLYSVKVSRWQHYNEIHRNDSKYRKHYDAGTLTPELAQVVVHLSLSWDMPLLMEYSLEFALFKTFAIPSISKILVDSKQMACSKTSTKRYMDTKILIGTWVQCPIMGLSLYDPPVNDVDPRANIAIARTNFLHSKYPITNNDLLYTLSLFVSEPIRFAEEYGWRPLSALECQAFFVFWQDIGRRMNISDIPETLGALRDWAKAYEDIHMVPAATNEAVATPNIEVLISILPDILGMRQLARKLTIALLPEHVRIAMLQEAQPRWVHALLNSSINAFAFVERHLLLPRREPFQFIERDLWKLPVQPEGKAGCPVKQHCSVWQGEPWYKPKPKNRMEWVANRLAVAIGRYTEMPSEILGSDGFVLGEVGPARFEKEGKDVVIKQAEQMLWSSQTHKRSEAGSWSASSWFS